MWLVSVDYVDRFLVGSFRCVMTCLVMCCEARVQGEEKQDPRVCLGGASLAELPLPKRHMRLPKQKQKPDSRTDYFGTSRWETVKQRVGGVHLCIHNIL